MTRLFSRLGWLLCLAACLLTVHPAPGIILLETGDPTSHTSTPGDNSGWQYEGRFGDFLATPVAPLYLLAAAHIGNPGTFVFHGETYTVVGGTGFSGTDLVLWQVDHAFRAYAPLFTASARSEVGQPLRVFGRGTRRGDGMDLNGTPHGWAWGPGDGVQRWGGNVVTDLPTSQGAQYVHATFDSPGAPDEAHLSVGDSSGGMFVQENGLWKLAAVNYGVDDLYTGADGSGPFTAALYDARGYYAQNNDQTYSLITGDAPVPTGFYSSRVASALTWIASVTGIDPAALPAESFAAWQTLYFTPGERADVTAGGPNADPDGDGVANLLEFAFNLDPTFAEPATMTAGTGLRGLPLVRLEASGATGDTRLTVEFVRRTAGSGGGLIYAVQFATGLAAGDWQTGGTESITAINARWERVKVTDAVPAGAPAQRFARVQVTLAADEGPGLQTGQADGPLQAATSGRVLTSGKDFPSR